MSPANAPRVVSCEIQRPSAALGRLQVGPTPGRQGRTGRPGEGVGTPPGRWGRGRPPHHRGDSPSALPAGKMPVQYNARTPVGSGTRTGGAGNTPTCGSSPASAAAVCTASVAHSAGADDGMVGGGSQMGSRGAAALLAATLGGRQATMRSMLRSRGSALLSFIHRMQKSRMNKHTHQCIHVCELKKS